MEGVLPWVKDLGGWGVLAFLALWAGRKVIEQLIALNTSVRNHTEILRDVVDVAKAQAAEQTARNEKLAQTQAEILATTRNTLREIKELKEAK